MAEAKRTKRFLQNPLTRIFNGGSNGSGKTGRPAARLLTGAALAFALATGTMHTAAAQENHPAATAASAGLSAYSQHVGTLNKTFGKLPGHVPIVMLDRDIINNMLARRGKPADDVPALTDAIVDYVRDVSGIEIKKLAGDDVARLYPAKSGTALHYTHALDPKRVSAGNDVCIVMARDPDRSRQSGMYQKMLFTPEVYGETLFNAGLKPLMSREEIVNLVDYHELSHCMDKTYAPMAEDYASLEDPSTLPHIVHKAEAFAEINALFLMARDGYDTSIAERRADMRAAYSLIAGPHIARRPENPKQGYLTPSHFGAIYSFDKAMRAAGDKISELGVDRLQDMSVDEINALSQTVVEEHTLSEDEFDAIHTHHISRMHYSVVSEFAEDPDEPPHWQTRKAILDAYMQHGLAALERVINTDRLDAPLGEAIPEYNISPPLNPYQPQTWEAAFDGPEHLLAEINAAYLDIKKAMAETGHDQDGLFSAVAGLRDDLRSRLDNATGDEDKAVRRKLAVMHAAAATLSLELADGTYTPALEAPAQPAFRKSAALGTPRPGMRA